MRADLARRRLRARVVAGVFVGAARIDGEAVRLREAWTRPPSVRQNDYESLTPILGASPGGDLTC